MPAPATGPLRWVYLAFALFFLACAVVGLFLPVMPTVPFLLLAAWAATRSSPRLLAWLEEHPRFGAQLKDWRNGGVVRRRSKWLATVVMTGSAVLMPFVAGRNWVVATAIALMAVVLAWLWRRPEQPPARPG